MPSSLHRQPLRPRGRSRHRQADLVRFDAGTGTLTPTDPALVALIPVRGRGMCLRPSGSVVYVVNELATTVVVFAFDPAPRTLHPDADRCRLLPGDFAGTNTAAEIAVDARVGTSMSPIAATTASCVFGIDPHSGQLHWRAGSRVGAGHRGISVIDPTGGGCSPPTRTGGGIVAVFRVDQDARAAMPDLGIASA